MARKGATSRVVGMTGSDGEGISYKPGSTGAVRTSDEVVTARKEAKTRRIVMEEK